jgi:L-threonylcarbamoyladenylate synthase
MPTYQIFNCLDDEAISKCASIVRNAGVVVFPTDTIYGIGCNPYIDLAVERIFAIKGRDKEKALPILAYSVEDIKKIVSLGQYGISLAKKFWPGALTIVAPLVDDSISHKVMGGRRKSLAVRIPANKCILALLSHCRYIVGTSANLSGQSSITSSKQILESGLDGFDALLDGGDIQGGVESTIVDITGKEPLILREGALASGEVLKALA